MIIPNILSGTIGFPYSVFLSFNFGRHSYERLAPYIMYATCAHLYRINHFASRTNAEGIKYRGLHVHVLHRVSNCVARAINRFITHSPTSAFHRFHMCLS